MKRIFCATLMCLVAFQTESMQITQYRPVAKKFAPSTDLIRGMILLNKGTLLEQRHYGNIKFADVSMKDFSICSRDDEGYDSVSKLIVMLFPSAGGSGLNATGTGSLEEIFKDDMNFETETDEPDNHGKIIAGLFKIANEVRKAVAERYKEGMDIHQLKREIGGIFDEIRKIDVEEVSDISKRLEEAGTIFKSIQEETKSIKTIVKSLQNAKGDTPVSIDEEKVSDLVEELNELSAISVCYSKGDINDLKAEFKSKGKKKEASSACIDFVDKFVRLSVGEKIENAEITLKICKKIRSILNEIQSLIGENGSIDENCRSIVQKIFSVCSEKVNSLPATASCISYINMGAKNIISGAHNNYLNFSESYFDISPKNLSKVQSERLYKLAKVTAESVLFERIENEIPVKDKWKQPYFPEYTNDVICAYVWGAYHGNLEKLAKTIEDVAVKGSGNKYVTRSNSVNFSAESVVDYKTYEKLNKECSELTEAVYENIKPNLSVVPFYANHRIVTNGTIRWKDGSQFADCVETTMRQLIATIFSKVVKDDDGKIIDLEIADERIPSNSHGLKEFFEKRDSRGRRMHIRQLANGGSPDIRDGWAKVCGEISGIDYVKEEHNLRPYWKNMIKLFCLLMKNYSEILKERSATPEEQAAANLIDKVNKDGDIDGDIIDALNTLLGIRTDVKLVAESNDLSKVKIYPNAADSSEDFLKCNELIFKVNNYHAQLNSIDLGTRVELNVDFWNYSSNLDGLDCIRKLYENETDFVLGCQIDDAYWQESGAVKLDNYPYPLLSFYQILKSCPEHCRHLLHSAVLDLLKYGNAQHCAKGVFRLSEDEAFWYGIVSHSFVEECYHELLVKEKKNFSAKNFIPFFENIVRSTDNIEKLAVAVGVFYSLKSLNISEEERKDLDRACQSGRQKLLQLLENANTDEAESCFHQWAVTIYRPVYKDIVVCFDSSMAEVLKRCVSIVHTDKSFYKNKVFLNRMMLILKNAGLIETKEVKDLIQDIPQKLREELNI